MPRRISRPVSLIVVVILVIYGYGIPPFLPSLAVPRIGILFAVAALPFGGSIEAFRGPDGDLPFIIVSVTLALCAFTFASALWAYSGQNEGRIAFLTIVSLNFLWWTFFVILGISNSENAQSTVNLVFSLVRPVIWISALWYFFTKKDILAYYHQSKEIDLQAD